jgi:hypothetical protein
MIMQVISSDGVSISPNAEMTVGQMTEIGGAKFRPEACPVTSSHSHEMPNQAAVGPPATDVTPFDPMMDTICLPLSPGNKPAYERWQLVNVAEEDHNFHIHQTKFRVLTEDQIGGTILPNSPHGRGIEFDNIPLRHAEGICGNNPPGDLSSPFRIGAQVSAKQIRLPSRSHSRSRVNSFIIAISLSMKTAALWL